MEVEWRLNAVKGNFKKNQYTPQQIKNKLKPSEEIKPTDNNKRKFVYSGKGTRTITQSAMAER
jgi:hypothetical protein